MQIVRDVRVIQWLWR